METRLEHVRANVSDPGGAIEGHTTVLGSEVESVWPPERPNYAHLKAATGASFAVMEAEGHGCPLRLHDTRSAAVRDGPTEATFSDSESAPRTGPR